MSPERNFYVYVHRRATDGSIFYVGKGSGPRRFKVGYGRNVYWQRVAKKHGWMHEKVLSHIPEPCAFSFERILICITPNLTNLSDGGGGASGYKLTPDQLERRRKPQSPSHAQKSRVAKLGKVNSPKTRNAIRLSKLRPVMSSEGEKFPSLNCAAMVMAHRTGQKPCQGNISKVIHGTRNTAYGLGWSYVTA